MLPGKRWSLASKIRQVLLLATGVVVITFGAMWYVASDVDQSATSASQNPNAGRFVNSQGVDANTDIAADVNERKHSSSESLVDSEQNASSVQRGPSITASSSSVTSLEESTGAVERSEDSLSEGIDLVGTAFPVSPSVKDTCDRISHLGEASCTDSYTLLEQLQKESRDKQWAVPMEQLIRELVSTKPGYSIRSLDCRSTFCAVEVESTLGIFFPDRRPLRGRLDWVDQHYGYEVNDNKERVKVTFVVLQRE